MAWTYTFDFKRSPGGWKEFFGGQYFGAAANWVPDQGWRHGSSPVARISLNKTFSSATIVTSITFVLSEPLNGDWKVLAGAIPGYNQGGWQDYDHSGITVTTFTLDVPPDAQRSSSTMFIDVASDLAVDGAPINASL